MKAGTSLQGGRVLLEECVLLRGTGGFLMSAKCVIMGEGGCVSVWRCSVLTRAFSLVFFNNEAAY